MPLGAPLPVRPGAKLRSRYYIRFTTRDLPGVIGAVGTILGRRGISIASVMQKEPVVNGAPARRGTVPIVIIVHRTPAEDMRAALAQMRRLACVRGRIQLLRIEERGE
jgi:homoserine dehydrogenase